MSSPAPVVERFAPSPTGPLHLGHAFSALTAHEAARAAGGRFLLRIEDIDATRCRPAFEAAIFDDLSWLGLRWMEPVLRQSARRSAYAAALTVLEARGLLYPCTCSRRDIALSAPQEGAAGPDGPPYPGTCRGRGLTEVRAAGTPHAVRLDMGRAIDALGGAAAVAALAFEEIGAGPEGETGRFTLDPQALRHAVGDVALARRDIGTSYHLAVVVDDAFQGVTHVTRGCDLFGSVPLHRLLQALLGLPVPVWRHHRLIRDATGRRLAKRDDARALGLFRTEGASPDHIRAMLGFGPIPSS
jgi:glutamyl-Q tRNA(Asp) synthetase